MTPITFFFRSLLLVFMLISFSAHAQDNYCDSLEKILPAQKQDTNKVKVLYKLCSCYYYDDTKRAIDYGTEALKLAEELNFQRGIAFSCNNLGIAYDNIGDNEKAAKLYFRAIKIKEELGNRASLASTYGNLGGVFDAQGEYDKAEEYHQKALKIGLDLEDSGIIAYAHQNIGIVEMERNNAKIALANFRMAVRLFYLLGDSLNYSNNLNNIGVIYFKTKQYDSVEVYYRHALDIRMRAGDELDLVNSYNNMGGLYIALGRYKEAEENYLKGMQLGISIGSLPPLSSSYSGLAEVYDSLHDYKQAYYYQKKFQENSDSLAGMNSKKDLAVLEYKYIQEKKEKEDAIRKEEEEKQRTLIYIFLIAILTIVTGFSVFLFNRFRIIRNQKTVIEEKTKEIVGSITYAKRLQVAILPPQKLITQLLPDFFIFYKPKDIVAGDFYWIENLRGKIFLAVADCTGHGVPGAMVSVVCSNALTRCVKEFGIDDPGMILDKVRELVIATFERSEDAVNDGMDITLVSLENSNGKTILKFAGANNSLWIAHKGELIVLPADHQPVGRFEHVKNFTTHEMELEKNDCIYLETDGYADQFGGAKGKKFKTANLKNLLLSNSDRSCAGQEKVVEMTFDNWKGNLEQVDDVCIMGVRIA